ncbi:hypothetical protein D3C84_1129660 [compost metagenome]
MLEQTLLRHLLVFGARLAVVAVWVDGDAAARRKFAPHLDVARVHEGNEVVHDDVHAILVKIAMVAEAEQIQFKRLALHHPHIGNVRNIDGRKIRLSRHGT